MRQKERERGGQGQGVEREGGGEYRKKKIPS
jgi:hypothetical protein